MEGRNQHGAQLNIGEPRFVILCKLYKDDKHVLIDVPIIIVALKELIRHHCRRVTTDKH